MAIKINAKILGIKEPIEVKESNRNMVKTLKVQKAVLKLETIDEDATAENVMDSAIESNQSIIDYIVDLLRLNSKQEDKLWELETGDTQELFNQIIMGMQHQTPEELEEAQSKEAAETAELSDTEKK